MNMFGLGMNRSVVARRAVIMREITVVIHF